MHDHISRLLVKSFRIKHFCPVPCFCSHWHSNWNAFAIISNISVYPTLPNFQSKVQMPSPQRNFPSSPQAEGLLLCMELFQHFSAF